MTRDQIKNWIKQQIRKNPEIAKEYKEQRLARLNAELNDNKRAFNREGYYSYRNPGFSRSIIENEDTISEIQSKTAEDLLVDDFMQRYGDTRSTEEVIEYIKTLDDEDRYIAGVFHGTKHNINCQEDLECRESRDDEELPKIRKIYKKGLPKREEYISIGAKFHQDLLAQKEEYLKEFEDIEERGPKIIQQLIDEEIKSKKYYCRSLAQMSVVDAFDKMGAHPQPRHAEEIDRIIEMHDPEIVEAVMQDMIENPTKNMLALAQNISEAPVQSRKDLKVMKAMDVVNLVAGTTITACGIVGAASGSPSWLALMPLAVGNFALGISGIIRHSRKTDNLDQKEILMSACIKDLLNEVTFRQNFADIRSER